MTLYWLSFCDPEKPQGSAFLGVSIVAAATFEDAIGVAWNEGVNPGGEVAGIDLPDDMAARVPDEYKTRLLTREQCAALDAILDGTTH